MHLTYDPVLEELRGGRPRTFTLGPLKLDAAAYERALGLEVPPPPPPAGPPPPEPAPTTPPAPAGA